MSASGEHSLAGDGRVALITGAGGGIGRGVASAFAEAGYRVLVADIDAEAGQQIADELNAAGMVALFAETDVTDEESVAAAVAKAKNAWGQLDFVLNNAGVVGRSQPIEQLDLANLDRVLAVNLRGPFLVCKHAVAGMRPAGGSIVNVSSITGRTGSPYFTAYGASKAGVEALTRGIARNLGRFNIRVNCLRPGSIDGTELMADFYAAHPERKIKDSRGLKMKIPVGRLGQARDISNLALFLASPLSRHINGEVLTIDGGESLGFQ